MLFDGMTDEEKALFAGVCKQEEYPAMSEIVRSGESGNSLLIVRKGKAEVRKKLDPVKYKTLKVLEAGDFFGEISFLRNAVRSADVIAVEECEMLELTMADFDKLSREHPMLGMKVYKNMAMEVAARLQKNNDDLKRAILWAME